MLINNTKQAAASISESFNDDDFSNIIDELSLSNSILVYITDTDPSQITLTEEHNFIMAIKDIAERLHIGA